MLRLICSSRTVHLIFYPQVILYSHVGSLRLVLAKFIHPAVHPVDPAKKKVHVLKPNGDFHFSLLSRKIKQSYADCNYELTANSYVWLSLEVHRISTCAVNIFIHHLLLL